MPIQVKPLGKIIEQLFVLIINWTIRVNHVYKTYLYVSKHSISYRVINKTLYEFSISHTRPARAGFVRQ